MKTYAGQVERLPDGVPSPWADPDSMRAWQAGEVVDLTAEDVAERSSRQSQQRARPRRSAAALSASRP